MNGERMPQMSFRSITEAFLQMEDELDLFEQRIGGSHFGIGQRYKQIMWNYSKFVLLFAIGMGVSLSLLCQSSLSMWKLLVLKVLAFIGLFYLLGFIAWGNAHYFLQYGSRLPRDMIWS